MHGDVIMSQLTILTGATHHKEAFDAVSNGMAVKFVHDSENKFSENAVWVVTDEFGIIGHVTEGYVPSGFKAYGDEAVRSPDILNNVIRENKTYEAIIDGKRPNGCLILFKTISEEVVEEEEEDIMDKWEIGTNEEEYTLVGCGHFVRDKSIGDKVTIGVENYAIDADGDIKGTATAFNENGEGIGLFPQTERKFADCEAMGGKYVSGDEIKSKYASDLLITDGYVIIDISKDGRFIKLGLEPVEEPVKETNDNGDELYMKKAITYGFSKMGELITLYDVENITEEPVEPTIEAESLSSVETELVALNEEIRALAQEEEAIKAKKEALMAKREELASINAKRIKLIDAIASKLENLELPVLEAIQAVISSSTPEEDTSSSTKEFETEQFEDALSEIKAIEDLKTLHNRCQNLNSYLGKICTDIAHINEEAMQKGAIVYKRHMNKLDDVQINELNMAIQRQEKIIKGIVKA